MRLAALLLVTALVLFGLPGCASRATVGPGTIAFLGDSLAAGYGVEAGGAYPELLTVPRKVVNLGVSGSTTADGLARLKDYLSGPDEPRLMVVALGANDILHGVDPALTEQNLDAIVESCQQCGILVLLCGISIPGQFGAHAIFEHVAEKHHVPLVPDLLQGVLFKNELMQEDGMHPNAAGQRVLATNMDAALRKYFKFAGPGDSGRAGVQP